MAAKIRVYELARELGLTNNETLELCKALGIGVKSHSSSIEDAQADRVRRKVEREGIRTQASPETLAEQQKGGKASPAPAKAAAPAAPAPAPVAPAVPAAPAADVAAAAAAGEGVVRPAAAAPAVPPASAPSAPAPVAPAAEAPARPSAPGPRPPAAPTGAPAGAPPRPGGAPGGPVGAPGAPRPAGPPPGSRIISSRPGGAAAPARQIPPPPGPRPASSSGVAPGPRPPAAPGTGAPVAPAASSAPAAPAAPVAPAAQAAPAAPAAPPAAPAAPAGPAPAAPPAGGPGTPPPPPGAPRRPSGPMLSPSGKPIPPPPGVPRSMSGKPIPPPPGPPRGPGGFAGRPGGPGGGPGARPGGPGARPGGGPGARPGGGAPGRPGGYLPGRPGGGFPRGQVPGAGVGRGGPGGGPGGPGGGPGGRGGPGGGRGQRPPQRQSRSKRRKAFEELEPTQLTSYIKSAAPVPDGEIIVERGVTAQELGPKLNRTAADVVRFLLQQGEMVTATQSLTDEMVEIFAMDIGAQVLLVDPGMQQEAELQALFSDDDEDEEALLEPRPPVITVMGHVDHGKTLLLDRIRSANVVAGEAGGITQHIGAYQALKDGRSITFIDTPGHEAFTAMRARGADVTDIVVLVVAADDGVMPQTQEAINHAKAAHVPIVVAINKIDREDADPNRVMQQLTEYELVPEAWGGETIMVELSALQNIGVDDLLEQLLVVAEIEDLVANPKGPARGTVLEANLDVGRGPVATVLIEKGTLRVGDPIVAGAAWGTVRAMLDDHGRQIKEAGPSTPVVVLGLSLVPGAGDELRVAPNLRTAKTVGEAREQRMRFAGLASSASAVHGGVKLEDIFEQIQKGEAATLNLILKADVQGSLEALTESLRKLERPEVKLAFVHRGVGGITENDIQLAATTGSTIIGFNVRPDRNARTLAETEKVEIRTYQIIYQILEDIQSAMVGMLKPEFEEVVTGDAEVRQVFQVPRVGAVAGCYVRNGTITRGSKVRFLREGVVIWTGSIATLRRFKDDVREVQTGYECGIGLSDFKDLKPGDVIETYDEREIPRT